jgi:sirohydrochlorin cobaltochelatase
MSIFHSPQHATVAGSPKAGLLLVGHGTRSSRGIEEFRQLAVQIANQAVPVPVEPAILEMCEPTIRVGIKRLLEQGVEHVIVLPLLLFAAGHAKRDIPHAVAAGLDAVGAGPVTSVVAGHLGCHPAIVELSTQRFTESLRGRFHVPASQTCLLLVGRGSLDESAIAEMHEFARLRTKLTPVAETRVAFIAMAQPAVRDMLLELAASGFRRVVIQPHLLLHGELYDGLLAQVANWQREQGVPEWIVTSYLACDSALNCPPDELVTRAVLDRAQAAGIRVVAPSQGG